MTEPTHYCQRCGENLSESWPYALCEACANKPCIHGNRPDACDACDLDGDRAYDEARERSHD